MFGVGIGDNGPVKYFLEFTNYKHAGDSRFLYLFETDLIFTVIVFK
jgi:hypothetical protein